MRLRFALVAVSCVCWSFAQACGGEANVDIDGSTDGTTGGDTNPPPPQDSGGQDVVVADTGTQDTGTADAGDGGTKPDSSTSGLAYRCGLDGGTVTGCSQCAGNVQPCAYCQTLDASVLLGVCVPMHTDCYSNAVPIGYTTCSCAGGDAGACPESYQICNSFGRCHTCSDVYTNGGLKCENGGTCDYADGGCL